MTQTLEAGAFVVSVLDQNEAFLGTLPSEAYGAWVGAIGGTIGGHLRHCLEHVENLLEARESGEVYFERRRRDPRVSGLKAAGLAELLRLREALRRAEGPGFLDQPLIAKTSLSGRLGESVAYPSCVGRELVYVGLHFVHHMSLMATAARLQGLEVDPDFGKAPATRAHEQGGLA